MRQNGMHKSAKKWHFLLLVFKFCLPRLEASKEKRERAFVWSFCHLRSEAFCQFTDAVAVNTHRHLRRLSSNGPSRARSPLSETAPRPLFITERNSDYRREYRISSVVKTNSTWGHVKSQCEISEDFLVKWIFSIWRHHVDNNDNFIIISSWNPRNPVAVS